MMEEKVKENHAKRKGGLRKVRMVRRGGREGRKERRRGRKE